jgi:hypothetical protein
LLLPSLCNLRSGPALHHRQHLQGRATEQEVAAPIVDLTSVSITAMMPASMFIGIDET